MDITRKPPLSLKLKIALIVVAASFILLGVVGAGVLNVEGRPVVNVSAEKVEGGEQVWLNHSEGGGIGDVIWLKDPDGAVIWGGKLEPNATVTIPLNAVPGRYRLHHPESNSTVANITVTNPKTASIEWFERDPGLRERYVYNPVIGTGPRDDWRTSPHLNDLAHEIAGDAETRREAYRALANYTADKVKNPSGHVLTNSLIPTKQVRMIRRRGRSQGDCTETALLLLAMSKSLGIPARYVMDGGLEPYGGTDDPGLKGHSWVEAYIDGRWVMADPSKGTSEETFLFDIDDSYRKDSLVTLPAVYIPSKDEYMETGHDRNSWFNNRELADKYLGETEYKALDVANITTGPYYDVKYTWYGVGGKLVFQSSVAATPVIYASKTSINDGRYHIRSGGDWEKIEETQFSDVG